MNAPGSQLCAPALVYLQRDAADLARICYGLTLQQIARRLHHEKRVWVATILITRGWPAADVSRTLGYTHSGSLYHHLKVV